MDIVSSEKAGDSDSSVETIGSSGSKNIRSKFTASEKNPKPLTSSSQNPNSNPNPSTGGSRSKQGNVPSSSSPTPKSLNRIPENFLVSLTGRIECGEVFGINDIYCKYNFSYGPDWQITTGLEEAISQITTKDLNGKFVWNFPLEVTFKSSNPHGWPQLVVSFYGSDFLGNHVARGYGSTFIPIHQGCITKTIPLFVPESSSLIQKISSWIVGRRPEFVDPKIVAQSEGRQVVRVNSCGHVTVRFETVLKDFRKLGYVSSSSSRSVEDYSM